MHPKHEELQPNPMALAQAELTAQSNERFFGAPEPPAEVQKPLTYLEINRILNAAAQHLHSAGLVGGSTESLQTLTEAALERSTEQVFGQLPEDEGQRAQLMKMANPKDISAIISELFAEVHVRQLPSATPDSLEMERIARLAEAEISKEPARKEHFQKHRREREEFVERIGESVEARKVREATVREINRGLNSGESAEVIIERLGGRETLLGIIGQQDLETLVKYKPEEEEE